MRRWTNSHETHGRAHLGTGASRPALGCEDGHSPGGSCADVATIVINVLHTCPRGVVSGTSNGHAHPDRERRLVSPDQRGGAHARHDRRRADRARPRGRGAGARPLPDRADAQLPRGPHRRGARHQAGPADGRVPPRRRAHPGRGPDRPRRAAPLPAPRLAVHDLLPYPRRHLLRGEVRHPERPRPGAAALVPQCRQRLHGPDRQPRARAAHQGLRQHPPLVPRAWTPSCSARWRPRGCSTCRGRCSPMSAASRPRRTSTTSSCSTCPAPSSWSATARSWPATASAIRTWCSPAGRRARS